MAVNPQLGLWGAAQLDRVAVSLGPDAPKTIIGHVRKIGVLKWIAEGDEATEEFDTPREAAEHGYRAVWGSVPH